MEELPVWFVEKITQMISQIKTDINENFQAMFISGASDDALREIELLEYILTLKPDGE
jgi:hypothetical protein